MEKPASDKQLIRDKYTHLRDALPEKEAAVLSEIIANKLLELPIWELNYFSLFLPMATKKEVDTHLILPLLQGHDKEICLPKVVSQTAMKHYLLTDNTLLKNNKWGIVEPQNGIEVPAQLIDVVVVPLLAFDLKGNRLGYGKGFYDRFFAQCKPDVIRIGLSYFNAEEGLLPKESTDVPLNYCITPEKTYKF